jgi:hypothetical protein
MPRIYTDDFPPADQEALEKKFEAILKLNRDGLDIATKIVTTLFRHWKADNPGFIALFAQIVNAYLYEVGQPYIRPDITAEGLLQFIMQSAYPQFIKEEAHGHSS